MFNRLTGQNLLGAYDNSLIPSVQWFALKLKLLLIQFKMLARQTFQ